MRFLQTKEGKTFLLLWLGQLVSILGSGLTNFGVGTWVFQLHHRATDFANIMLAATLPGLILSPVIGALADRWEKRKVLIYAELGGAIASLGLATVALTGQIQLWHIYVLGALNTIFVAFTWPSMSAMVTTLVSKENLGRANGFMQFNESASMILGPMIGGLVMFNAGLPGLVIADVLSFVICIGLLIAAKLPAIPPLHEHADNTFIEDMTLGFKYTWERKGLLSLMGFFFMLNFVSSMTWALYTPLLLTFYNEKITGFIQGFFGVGALFASLAVGFWGTPLRKSRTICICGGTFGVINLLLGFHPAIPLYIAVCLLVALVGTFQYSCSQSIWMSKVPPALHGRVFSVRRLAAGLATPFSFALAGPLADNFFGPGMTPGGQLAHAFGWIGTGPGAGIRLFFVFQGVAVICIATATWLLNPHMRNVESELPDNNTPLSVP